MTIWQAFAAAPHPDHGMTAPTFNAIAGAIADTEAGARVAIERVVVGRNLPAWRIDRMIREARVRPVLDSGDMPAGYSIHLRTFGDVRRVCVDAPGVPNLYTTPADSFLPRHARNAIEDARDHAKRGAR